MIHSSASPTIQISRYPNRRLYDRTHSRHVTQEELYDLVVKGGTVQITDSATGHDITSQTLLQLLIERDPIKLAAVPAEIMHLIVRSSEGMLQSFFAQAMSQMFQSIFAAMPRPAAPAQAAWPFGWPMPGAAPPQSEPPPRDDAADMKQKIDDLTAQLDELRRRTA